MREIKHTDLIASVASINNINFWLQLSGYRKHFVGTSLTTALWFGAKLGIFGVTRRSNIEVPA